LANSERDSVGFKGGSGKDRRGAACSKAQEEGGQVSPQEGTLLFRGKKGETTGGCYKHTVMDG